MLRKNSTYKLLIVPFPSGPFGPVRCPIVERGGGIGYKQWVNQIHPMEIIWFGLVSQIAVCIVARLYEQILLFLTAMAFNLL